MRNRAHADDHVAGEHACGRAGDVRVIHRHIHALLDLADGNTRLEQRALKRKAAPDQEADELTARIVKKPRYVGIFARHHAVFVDAVFRNIARDVASLAEDGEGAAARLRHLEQRAGFRVALAEQQKIPRQFPGENDEVALRVAVAHARGRRGDLPRPDEGANVLRAGGCVISHGRSPP